MLRKPTNLAKINLTFLPNHRTTNKKNYNSTHFKQTTKQYLQKQQQPQLKQPLSTVPELIPFHNTDQQLLLKNTKPKQSSPHTRFPIDLNDQEPVSDLTLQSV